MPWIKRNTIIYFKFSSQIQNRLFDRRVEGIEEINTLSVFFTYQKYLNVFNTTPKLIKWNTVGYGGVTLKWFKMYLIKRKQFVEMSNIRSKDKWLSREKTLRVLFSVHFTFWPMSMILVYSYDRSVWSNMRMKQLSVSMQTPIVSCIHSELEMTKFLKLNNVVQHLYDLKLKTNPTKSSFVQFCLLETKSDHSTTVMFEESEAEEVYSVKFLGIHLDWGLTWSYHVDKVCYKRSSENYVLRHLSQPRLW